MPLGELKDKALKIKGELFEIGWEEWPFER